MGHDNLQIEGEGKAFKPLVVKFVAAHEQMSRPFGVDVIATAVQPKGGAQDGEGPRVKIKDIIGQAVLVKVRRDKDTDNFRGWSGVVETIEQVRWDETPGAESTYHLRVAPTIWLMSKRSSHRIHQHKTLPDVIKIYVDEWKIDPVEWRIDQGSYPKKEYCVQYGETDLDFVHRLLEEAGISYFFENQGSSAKSVLVFSDQPQAQAKTLDIKWTDNPNEVHNTKWVKNVHIAHKVKPGLFQLSDYNFRKPKLPLFAKTEPAQGAEGKREIYHYDPGGFLVETGGPGQGPGDEKVADDKSTTTHDHEEVGKARAKRFLEAERIKKRYVAYETSEKTVCVGKVLGIQNHPHGELEGQSLLTIETMLRVNAEGEWAVVSEAAFTDAPFRPQRVTPKPRVEGVQSAIVVAPKGGKEEIYTDEFERVRVRFHWEREGDFDDTRTCWLRVAQPWAGAQYGMTMIPRVGHEVIVDFLDGDPDHPLVVGKVYAQPSPTPYKLPDHQTKSTWQTSTTPDQPDGKSFNEIMFEDEKEKELVYIQAQRNLMSLTKRNETERTGKNRTQIVGRDRLGIVREVDSVHMGEKHLVQMVTINDLKILELGQPQVTKKETFIEVKDEKISFTTGKASIVLDGGNIAIKAQKGIRMSADKNFIIKGGPMVFINAMPAFAMDPRADKRIRDEAPKPEGDVLNAIVRLFISPRNWADEIIKSAPPRDPDDNKKEQKKYDERQADIKTLQQHYPNTPPGTQSNGDPWPTERPSYLADPSDSKSPVTGEVSPERLRIATEGGPSKEPGFEDLAPGERVPLVFKDKKQFDKFKAELQEVLDKHGITDATVQQIGSGTTGYPGNPKKALNRERGPWNSSKDNDFAVFSDQMLAQAMESNVPVNNEIQMGDEFTVLRNGSVNGNGFYDTPVGKDLEGLAKKWDKELYGKPVADGVEFKMNLGNKPFKDSTKLADGRPLNKSVTVASPKK